MENIIPFPADKARKPANAPSNPMREYLAGHAERLRYMAENGYRDPMTDWLTSAYDWK